MTDAISRATDLVPGNIRARVAEFLGQALAQLVHLDNYSVGCVPFECACCTEEVGSTALDNQLGISIQVGNVVEDLRGLVGLRQFQVAIGTGLGSESSIALPPPLA